MPVTVLLSSSWEDPEPDRLTIEATIGEDENGESEKHACVTFSCSYTWLDPDVVEQEVIPFLRQCVNKAREHNLLQELRTKRDI